MVGQWQIFRHKLLVCEPDLMTSSYKALLLQIHIRLVNSIAYVLQESDINLDGEIDREEFVKFIQKLTAGTFVTVSQGLILTLVVAPTVAVATKKATEGVPGVGKVVQKLPNSIYASIITLAVVLFQKTAMEPAE